MKRHINIPIFVPHKGCPHDCVFCNQKHITGLIKDVESEDIIEIIESHLASSPADADIEIAFFGGSFTAIERDVRIRYLSLAYKYVKTGAVSGIRISTRPDYITEEILDELKLYGVKVIELGVQSMDEEVLKASDRGHTAEDVKNASRLIKQYGFTLGLQMMTGLPCDTPKKSIKTANEIIALEPSFVRIYPTLVIRDTRLEDMYSKGEYIPQKLNEAVDLVSRLMRMFKKAEIGVIRVSLAVTEDISPGGKLVAGPFHSAFRELCESRIYYEDMLARLHDLSEAVVAVNPSEVSKVIGNKRENVLRLEREHNISIKVIKDKRIKKGNIKVRKVIKTFI